MSQNPSIDQSGIERALQLLGQHVRHSARVFLFGGTALIHMGLRTGVTKDIDLWSLDNQSEVDAAVQQLRRQQISVDFVDFELFLPLAPDWDLRSIFVRNYGMLQVYYLDPYTIALTKINRSSQRDIADLQLFAQNGLITRDDLIHYYAAISPFLGRGAYALVAPAVYDAKFQAAVITVWGP